MFGSWVTHATEFADAFASAEPVRHVVIPGFLSSDAAARLAAAFPVPDWDQWYVYDNPLESKLATDKLELMPSIVRDTFEELGSPAVIAALRAITGHADLALDADNYGAGLHCVPPGGHLGVHLDYSRHPSGKFERKLNVVLCLTPPDWREDEAGELELWHSERVADGGADGAVGAFRPTTVAHRVRPLWNSAILFEPGDRAFHGLPRTQPLTARPRNTLAAYYVVPWTDGLAERHKATFFPTTADQRALAKLYDIRATRRLEAADVAAHAPAWRSSMVRGSSSGIGGRDVGSSGDSGVVADVVSAGAGDGAERAKAGDDS